MPKTVIYTANQGASTETANLLAGDVNEFVQEPSMVRITAVSSAIGIKLTVLADSDVLIDKKEIPFIGTSLIDKDHLIDEFAVDSSTRLIVRAAETAAVATTDHYLGVEIQPL